MERNGPPWPRSALSVNFGTLFTEIPPARASLAARGEGLRLRGGGVPVSL